MSEIKVNLVTPRSGTTVTLGEAGDTIALGACASQTGFGSECMSWCSSIKTAGFTAAAGNGYFINTCGGAFEVTLPATASVGDEINFTDFARTWGCAALTLCTNSLKFQGNTTPKPEYDTSGATVKIVYSGTTQGWIPQLDKGVALETPQTYNVQYLVVAGGAGGSSDVGGGGGAGGMRLVATKSFSVCKGATIPVTVGGGGAKSPAPTACGNAGTTSVFSTITSAGGGGGGGSPRSGNDGGSGGGGSRAGTAGAGNTPPTPCTQGNNGGDGYPSPTGAAGGGGGHSCVGTNGVVPTGGAGGDGTGNGIRGTPFDPVAYAGGGGGGGRLPDGSPGGAGGAGGGGAGGPPSPGNATPGTTNTGGGGGGGNSPGPSLGGDGGSGIVIIRRLTACSTSTSGTVTTCGSDTIHTFTGDGTFVV